MAPAWSLRTELRRLLCWLGFSSRCTKKRVRARRAMPSSAGNSTLTADRFRYMSYAAMVGAMRSLAATHPDLVRLWNTQERFGLPSAGRCAGGPCLTWVLELTHWPSAQRDDARAGPRPDVLISGAFHGDERVVMARRCG